MVAFPPTGMQNANYPGLSGGVTAPTGGALNGNPPTSAAGNNGAQSGNAPLSAFNTSNATRQTPQDQAILNQALARLGLIRSNPAHMAYFRHMGLNPPFNSGQEALQLIRNGGFRVEFGDMGDSPAHAQWVNEDHVMMINQRTRDEINQAMQAGRTDEVNNLLDAMAAALFHEAGHAKDGDGESSIQEESECMTLNTTGDCFFKANDPIYAQSASSSPLIADGVGKYTQLLFDQDLYKNGFVNRMVQKYGDLPMFSPNHQVPPPRGIDGQQPLPLTYRIAAKIDSQNVANGTMPPSPSLGQVPPGLLAVPSPVPMTPPPSANSMGLSPAQIPPGYPPTPSQTFSMPLPGGASVGIPQQPGQRFSASA